jgi:hypothetical protein
MGMELDLESGLGPGLGLSSGLSLQSLDLHCAGFPFDVNACVGGTTTTPAPNIMYTTSETFYAEQMNDANDDTDNANSTNTNDAPNTPSLPRPTTFATSLRRLIDALSISSPGLTDLHLSQQHLDDDCLFAITQASFAPTLKVLEISSLSTFSTCAPQTALRSPLAAQLFDNSASSSSSSSPSTPVVAPTPRPAPFLQALFPALDRRKTQLSVLRLISCKIPIEEIDAMVSASCLTQLKELDLSNVIWTGDVDVDVGVDAGPHPQSQDHQQQQQQQQQQEDPAPVEDVWAQMRRQRQQQELVQQRQKELKNQSGR